MVDKRGRPRERGERQPNGDRRRSTIPANLRSEAQFQRLKQNAVALGLDPMMTSQAGRLFCTGMITARHMATIEYISKVYAAHARHVGKEMTRRLRSPSHEPSTNRAERLDEDFDTTSDALTAKLEFEQLRDIIPELPREARDCIERLCVDDEAIPTPWIASLCVLLTMIEECRSGERSAVKLTRGNLPLRRRTAKTLTREEKFDKGAYALPGKPAPMTPADVAAAAADREGLTRMLKTRQAQPAEGVAP